MSGSARRERDETPSERDRGVSDVVAFVLTFAIIIAGVGLVSTGGFDRLTTFTNDQQLDNSDRGMQAAAASVGNLERNGDTYREFDLSLGGGNVWFNETEIGLSSDSSSLNDSINSTFGSDGTVSINALEHRFDLSSRVVNLAYEGGGVFRTGTVGPRLEPAVTFDEKRGQVIVSLVNLTTDESIDRSGSFASDLVLSPTRVPEESPVGADKQLIGFSAEQVGQKRVYETGVDGELEINVSGTAYPDQWAFYFEEREGWSSDGDTYSVAGDDLDVLVRVTTVELSVDR